MVIILCCLFLSSCFEVEMHDSTSDPIYSSIIGKKFKLKEDLLALGVSSDNKLPADYVVLVAGVGFSGPEVVSRMNLPKGCVFQLDKVLTAKSIMSSKVAYVFKEIGSNHLKGKEIRATLTSKSDDANYGLDANSFEIVN